MNNKETKNKATSNSTQTEPKLQVPPPPPSADIGVGSKRVHAFDSASDATKVFITEGKSKK